MNKTLFFLKGLESQIIQIIKESFPAPYEGHVGNDCSIYSPSQGAHLLVTKDLLVENTHFYPTMPLKELAYRCLAVNVSDIFADGGTPKAFIIGLGIPPSFHNKILEFSQLLCQQAQEMEVPIIGGDCVSSKQFFVSITCLGESVEPLWLRKNAQIGDYLYVTGVLGGSQEGLRRVQQNQQFYNLKDIYVQKHLAVPYKKETILALHQYYPKKIHAAIDISDGFLTDLYHILAESQVGVNLEKEAIPLFNSSLADNLDNVFYGGEDYEIIFTASDKIDPHISPHLKDIVCIGQITDQPYQIFFNSKGKLELVDLKRDSKKIYQHFN